MSCELTILNKNKSDIIINIYQMAIEYSPGCIHRDYLSITSATDGINDETVYYCGKNKTKLVLKSKSALTIAFRSDNVIERKGFKMRIDRVKKLAFDNECCRQNVFFTSDGLIMDNFISDSNKGIAHCFGNIWGEKDFGLLIRLTKLNISRNFYSCEEGYIKITYLDDCSKTEVEKVFCGILLSELSIVAHTNLVQFEIKAPISSQVLIKYRSLRYKERRCQFTAPIKYVRLTSLRQQIEFNLTNSSKFIIDQSNDSIMFAMKIETFPGWKINVNWSDTDHSKFEIRFTEYFEYDLNIYTIENMAEHKHTNISSNSYQLTLIIKVADINNSSLIGLITISDVTAKTNLINMPMKFENVRQLMGNKMFQIVNDLKLGNLKLPASILKIKTLALFNEGEQDYSCNQSGIYIYNKTDEIFGPYCHESDFIPLKEANLRLIYYYFTRNDYAINPLIINQTMLELRLEFYPCNFTTLSGSFGDFGISKFHKCLTFFEPISLKNTMAYNLSFLLSSTEEVALFRVYSRTATKLDKDITSIGSELVISTIKSKVCFYKLKINQLILVNYRSFLKISINTSCEYIPSGWSVHLELKSRKRIECTMFSQNKGFDKTVSAEEGILTGDVRAFSSYTQESVIFPVCYWYFKGNKTRSLDIWHRMLSLKMEFFHLDCEKYELSIIEKIDSAVHKVVLSNNATVDLGIFSRSTNDIYITLTYRTTSGMTKIGSQLDQDYFLLSFEFVTKKIYYSKFGCYANWWRIGDDCVKFENKTNISWRDAHALCSGQNSTLIKIENFEKRDGLKSLALTKWFSNIYSSESVVIFIGLKNEINGDFYRLKWPKYEPMIYGEWFGRSSHQIYSYVSPSLHGIVSKTLPQPSVENNNQQCTAMMMQHPMYWFNWVKIPCDSKIPFSSFICEKPAIYRTTKTKNYFDDQLDEMNDPDKPRCEESWIFNHNKCLMIIFFNSRDTLKLDGICKLKNANVSSMTTEEAMRSKELFKELWPHVVGSIYYRDDTVIRSILETGSKRHVICERPTTTWGSITNQYPFNNHLFWCSGKDQYWISIDNKCDSKIDCLQSMDDEKECEEYKLKEFPLSCGKKSISWNRFCDFVPDCPDESDELFCVHPPCNDINEWQCANKKCIRKQNRCDLIINCLDGSDEKECNTALCNGFNCSSSVCLPRKYVNDDIVDCPGVLMEDEVTKPSVLKNSYMKEECSEYPGDIKSLCSARSNKCMDRNSTCIYRRDNLGTRDVCPMMDHLQNCKNFTCPGLFQCIKMKYCIQLHYVCDGVKDCPDGEDEDERGCTSLTCPLYFRCIAADRKHLICLERRFLCNGIRDCFNGIDEKYCDGGVCPPQCNCTGFKIYCNNTSKHIIRNIIQSMRFISIENTTDIEIYGKIFARFPYLGYLSLSRNYIRTLVSELFYELYNLLVLDLSINKITILPAQIFTHLRRLQIIDLSKNPIRTIEPFSLSGLIALASIKLVSMNFAEIPNNMFSGMSSNLISINMSGNDIKIIDRLAFEGISNLSSLDLTVTKIDIGIIGEALAHLSVKSVHTNIYKICCSLAKFDSCSAATDIASNCDNLLANSSIKVIVWIIGITGLLGNIVVILWRLLSVKNSKKISNEELLVLNLAISDLLLSIYLVIIVTADHYYRNQYVENSIVWKSGYTCTIAGYLATVSNQASATFLGLITLDRVICIVLTSWKSYVRIIKYLIIPVWLIWTSSLAFLEYYRFSQVESVQSNGLCLSYFSLDYQSNLKNSFSIALIIYILISLILIVCGYIIIFIYSCRTRRTAGRTLMLNDYKSARKMLILVMVFFLCWFPMIVLSFISKNVNYRLTNDQLTWLTVVLMPLNSCLNPYLYTFSNVSLCFNKRQSVPKKTNIYTMSVLQKK